MEADAWRRVQDALVPQSALSVRRHWSASHHNGSLGFDLRSAGVSEPCSSWRATHNHFAAVRVHVYLRRVLLQQDL